MPAGTTLHDILNSSWFIWLCVFIIFAWLWIKLMTTFTGKPIGQIWLEWRYGKKLEWKDVDAQVAQRIIDGTKSEARHSKDRNAKFLNIRAQDNVHYNSERSLHRLGKIYGMATFHEYIEVVYRPAWRLRRFTFIAMPTQLLSSTSEKNIVFDGISVKELAQLAFEYPIPSIGSPYTEEDMHEFALGVYDLKRTIVSKILSDIMGENSLLSSGSSRSDTRLAIQNLKRLIHRGEEYPESSQQQNQQSQNQGGMV